jgi:hypothetical protein
MRVRSSMSPNRPAVTTTVAAGTKLCRLTACDCLGRLRPPCQSLPVLLRSGPPAIIIFVFVERLPMPQQHVIQQAGSSHSCNYCSCCCYCCGTDC